jgi:outer membrane lipoprotein-sorting protein
VDFDDTTFIYDGHDYSTLNKKTGHYSVIHYTRPWKDELDKWSTAAGIEKMWRLSGKVVRKNVRKELNGLQRDAIELDVTSLDFSWCQRAKITIFLDPKTNRVDTLLQEFRRDSGEVVRRTTDHHEYNVSVDPSLFKFKPPAGAVLDSETTEPAPTN